MQTHIVIVEFAKKYGIKEGLLLTELCRRVYISGSESIPFSVSQGKAFFPYMSEKQIRLALRNLRTAGSIAIVQSSPTFDRTRWYRIHETLYQYYLQFMLIPNQLLQLNENMLSQGGE
jgi:hypothetical protein